MRVQTPGRGPLFPDQGPLGARIYRRVFGITVEVVLFVLMTVLSPLLMLVAFFVDLTLWLIRRKPWVSVRLAPAIWWFLFGEMKALLKLIGIYALTGGPFGTKAGSVRRRRWIYILRIAWARNHLGAVRILFGLKFEIDGERNVSPGPYILMIRHASIIDNLLPDVLIGHEYGIGVRFVIKREIQTLPAIDIGGRWVPTVFIKRGSLDPKTEIQAVRDLTHDMSEGEIVGIYPEGTRPTPTKVARAQEIIRERQPEIAPLAARLNNLLPPRMGGPLALIDEAAAGTDMVFCAHVGFDGLRTVGDLWGAELVGQTIKLKFWRFAGEDIPVGDKARTVWLFERWQELDDWVSEQLAHQPA